MPMALSLNRNLIESRILYASSVVMYVSCSNVLHIPAERRGQRKLVSASLLAILARMLAIFKQQINILN
jgi:hypothetical protein